MTASIATAGRVCALIAAAWTLLAMIVAEVFVYFTVVDVVALLGCVALAGLAVASLVRPNRAFDAASLFVVGTLAGLLLLTGAELTGGLFSPYSDADAG